MRVDEHVNYNIRLDIPTGTILNELHHDIFELIRREEQAAGASPSNILQSLAILRGKGILRTRKDTNRVFYPVSDQRTFQPKGMMREVFCGIEARQ